MSEVKRPTIEYHDNGEPYVMIPFDKEEFEQCHELKIDVIAHARQEGPFGGWFPVFEKRTFVISNTK